MLIITDSSLFIVLQVHLAWGIHIPCQGKSGWSGEYQQGSFRTTTQVWWGSQTHFNDVTSSKRVDTLICQTTIRRNPINFLYIPAHVTLWCVEVGPVVNAREGSMQEHDRARVGPKRTFSLMLIGHCHCHCQYYYCVLNWVTFVLCDKDGGYFEYRLKFQIKPNVLHHYDCILLVKLLWQNQNYQLVLGGGWEWSLRNWLIALDSFAISW